MSGARECTAGRLALGSRVPALHCRVTPAPSEKHSTFGTDSGAPDPEFRCSPIRPASRWSIPDRPLPAARQRVNRRWPVAGRKPRGRLRVTRSAAQPVCQRVCGALGLVHRQHMSGCLNDPQRGPGDHRGKRFMLCYRAPSILATAHDQRRAGDRGQQVGRIRTRQQRADLRREDLRRLALHHFQDGLE